MTAFVIISSRTIQNDTLIKGAVSPILVLLKNPIKVPMK